MTPEKARRKTHVARTDPPTLPSIPPLSTAESQAGYYRFPAIHGDRIIFCSDDDLWLVPVAGGVARRLTVGRGPVQQPVFSPDGRRIAFVGAEEGVPEVYLMDAEGGETRRMTFLGGMTAPVAWSRDGAEIIIATDSGGAFVRDQHLHRLSAASGLLTPLGIGPARSLNFEFDGPGVVIARNGGDPARWKRYRGGMVGSLWVDRRGSGDFRAILSNLKGNLASPMWIARRIYFISDHEGIANIYSCRTDGGDIRRHTNHSDFYARFPMSDGERIVYHAGADVHLFDPASGESRRIPIEIRTPRPRRQRKFISGSANLEDYEGHPSGHSVVLTLRGRPIAMGLWEGPATEFGIPWQARHRLARWLNDGRRIVAVTDADGEEKLEIFTPGTGPIGWSVERFDLGVNLGRIVEMVVAPGWPAEGVNGEPPSSETRGDDAHPAGQRSGQRIARAARRRAKRRGARDAREKGAIAGAAPIPNLLAVANHRNELWVIDLDRRRAKRIDLSEHDRILGVSWSPDARWVAYGFAVGSRHTAIRIADTATGEWRQVTSGDFIDFGPCFDPEGRYLYFLSMRTYDPVYDMVQFELGFPRSVRPHLIPLRADEPSPFTPSPRPLSGNKRGALLAKNPWEMEGATRRLQKEADEKKKTQRVTVQIDFESIAERILAFPIQEGRYRAIDAIPGRIFFLADPIEGSLGHVWSSAEVPARSSIEVYDLRELKPGVLATGLTDFRVSRDGKTLIYRVKNRLRAVLATAEPGKLPADEAVGRASGWIDLSRARCSVEPAVEWRQMLAEAWRLQRDHFWSVDMSRVDWPMIYQRYAPLVERVSTRGELSDLIWEMQGELGTSHCYEMGGDYQRLPSYPIGFLGADLRFDPQRGVWQVAAIPRGDSWDGTRSSPLAAPGLKIMPGAVIHAINGRELGPQLSPAQALVNFAGQEVWLTISDPPVAEKRGRRARNPRPKTRAVTVRTLSQEFGLRYRAWVESNRDFVHERSRGRVGYLHIPNMGPLGYSEFHRYFLAEINRDALIVDVRSNAGGHVSQLLLEKLLRRRVGWDVSRHRAPVPYPFEAPKGPMVALTDELAGSDGDIFSHAWKIYRLGPLIGKRTWGGVVGVSPRMRLVDGTLTTQPELAFWFKDVGWNVENYGTDPDIEVDFRPQDYRAGRDPQLERGILEARKLLRSFTEAKPDLKKKPSRQLPRPFRP